MTAKILIIDDESDIRMLVAGFLKDEGYQTIEAKNSTEALSLFSKEKPDIVILDIWLEGSDLDGIEILKKMKEVSPFVPIIMMSGHGTIETAVSSIKIGAYDFIEKPFKTDRLLFMIQRAIETYKLKKENEDLRQLMFGEEEIIGDSFIIQGLKQTIKKVAPTSSRVFISGASGSGKELVAKQIHLKSSRKDEPFIIINCAGISEEQGSSYLFGEERNGEVIRTGILEKAEGGTLLLDEITDMPSDIQSKMVRLMQEQCFERLHGEKKIKSNIRFIASSTKDITEEINKGKLREDLYYRLNVVPIQVPSLKDRRDDIIPLINYFMSGFTESKGEEVPKIADDALLALETYDWPGNARQLRNVLEWLVILNPDSNTVIHKDMLPPEISKKAFENYGKDNSALLMSLPLKEAREAFEKEYFETQLKRFGDNISKTARFIGMERSAFYRKLKGLGFDFKKTILEETEE